MKIRPELQALRSDDAPQRHAQQRLKAELADWRAHSPAQLAEDELARLADGAVLEDLPLLAALFTPGDATAQQFVGALVSRLCAGLAEAPLGVVPLRHFTDDALSSIMLARSGFATLSLQAFDGIGMARRPRPVSASFSPSQSWDQVLAGSASAELVHCRQIWPTRADLEVELIELSPGAVLTRNNRDTALLIGKFEGGLVSLRLQNRTINGGVTREYQLSDGALVHQAAGTPRESRLELTAALLGRMGRADAAPLLAAMAQEDGSAGLRWQTLRECLGLDSAEGFHTLCTIARNSADPLAAPAGALRAQLLETHPQLAKAEQCPV
jgi:hypothetical protein